MRIYTFLMTRRLKVVVVVMDVYDDDESDRPTDVAFSRLVLTTVS